MLDVVQLSEEAVFLRRAEVLELLERLASEIAAVHEEEHSFGTRMFDQSVDEIASGIGFAAAAGHLDQRARPGFGQ